MARIIRCECGYISRGQDDAALLTDARHHIASAHAELVGQVADDDLLAMAEEE